MGLFSSKNDTAEAPVSIYDQSIALNDGSNIDLQSLKGKHILFVNVASECGFTGQYEGLQKLHEEYGDKVAVIGLPCNQFGGQEPGSDEEIATFCTNHFSVTFPITTKIEVKGDNQHPLYAWLTKAENNGRKSSSVKWNFQKYLVDPNGQLVDVYYSMTKPMSKKIIKHFA